MRKYNKYPPEPPKATAFTIILGVLAVASGAIAVVSWEWGVGLLAFVLAAGITERILR